MTLRVRLLRLARNDNFLNRDLGSKLLLYQLISNLHAESKRSLKEYLRAIADRSNYPVTKDENICISFTFA